MEESRLDNELKRIQEGFPFLWESYNFHITFFTRDYGVYYRGFIIGLENNTCKLVFTKETNSSVEPIAEYIGKKTASFKLDQSDYSLQDGWYSLTGLMFWLTGIEYEYDKNVDQDLQNVSQYLNPQMDKVIELFQFPDEFDRKLEHYRALHKGKQITVEKIREERARLQALGQDSSLEAAITSLRGDKK
ncbi:MAG: hypothetical protein ABI618_16685 [Nitrospirota bacterium]